MCHWTGYTPLLYLGYKRPVQMEDEFALPPHLKCEATYPSFAAGLQRRMDTMKETEQVRGCHSLPHCILCHHLRNRDPVFRFHR